MCSSGVEQYGHIHRKKTWFELLRMSTAVMGIEFAYSAETSFVSPLLLELGMEHGNVMAVWAISPVLGLLLGPLMGVLSDRCSSPLGRRRPFIVVLAIGLMVGTSLVPYGKELGVLLGDDASDQGSGGAANPPMIATVVTVVGTVLMDFNADVCQCPTRAYLLEVTGPDDHTRGLSAFTALAGVGGFLGYVLGAIDWNSLNHDTSANYNIKFVFMAVASIFIVSIVVTVTTFKEIPLYLLKSTESIPEISETYDKDSDGNSVSLKSLVVSTFLMPKPIMWLYVTNLLTWMSHLSYVLYFTDFVGEEVFGGVPNAPPDSFHADLYNEGVRFGCWGLALSSISCTVFSMILERLIKRMGAKCVYVGGLLVFSAGMTALAVLKSKMAVLVLSITAGVGYSILLNMPYIMLAYYHTKQILNGEKEGNTTRPKRGLGTDLAIIGSTVFVAQISLSLGLGAVTEAVENTTTTIWSAAFLSLIAGLMAIRVTYLDL